jgi:pilus assembly protein FimV
MVEKYSETQYDDDLTVGISEGDDYASDSDVDLFEFYGEEETTLARLKTVVLSIDWEITDDNLKEFNVEIRTLKDELNDDKINLIYVQALEKINKYIYKERANSNPNAIKLMLSFYYTLEKNLSSSSITEKQMKKTLLEDLKRFDRLKKQIAQEKDNVEKTEVVQAEVAETSVVGESFEEVSVVEGREPAPVSATEVAEVEAIAVQSDSDNPLLSLKAIVLGMDWEITETELRNLAKEVKKIESNFAGQKPKLILLQGISVLGAYIRHRKSNAHADAFTLLHAFYNALEDVVIHSYSRSEEKSILMPLVEKFNEFKGLIANTIDKDAGDVQENYEEYDEVAPAFSDVDENVRGFDEAQEASQLKDILPENVVESKIDQFFSDIPSEKSDSSKEQSALPIVKKDADTADVVENFFGDTEEDEGTSSSVESDALSGVNVETEADDDSDEAPLPISADGELAPALAGDTRDDAEADDGSWQKTEEAAEVFNRIDSFFGDEVEEPVVEEKEKTISIDVEEALKGVDVETEADDDSDEEPLLVTDEGEFAPALADDDSSLPFGSEDSFEPDEISEKQDAEKDVESSLNAMFGDEEDRDSADTPFAETSIDEEIETSQYKDQIASVDDSLKEEDDEIFEVNLPEAEVESEAVVDTHVAAFFDDEEDSPELSADDQAQNVMEDQLDGDGDASFDFNEKDDTHLDYNDDSLFEDVSTELDTLQESDDNQDVLFSEEELLSDEEEDISSERVDEIVQDNLIGAIDQPETVLADDEYTSAVKTENEDISAHTETDEEIVIFELVEDEEESLEEVVVFTPDEDQALSRELDSEPEFIDQSNENVVEDGDFEAGNEEPLDTDELVAAEESEDITYDADEGAEFDEEFTQLDDQPGLSVDPENDENIEDDSEFTSSELVDGETELLADNELPGESIVEVFSDDVETENENESTGQRIESEEGVFVTEQLFDEDDLQEPASDSQDKAEPFDSVDSTVSDGDSDEVLGFEEEDLEEYFRSTGLGGVQQEDILLTLKTCVASITIELNDEIVQSLLAEINKLRQKWYEKPVSKTLLQLMSTVVQHVDQYRYEASSEAHGHILSILDKIELLELGNIKDNEAEEILLGETSRILLWQQKMLDRQAVKKGDSLTFIDPVRAEGDVAPKDIEFIFTEEHIVEDEDDDEFILDSDTEHEEDESFQHETSGDDYLETEQERQELSDDSDIGQDEQEELHTQTPDDDGSEYGAFDDMEELEEVFAEEEVQDTTDVSTVESDVLEEREKGKEEHLEISDTTDQLQANDFSLILSEINALKTSLRDEIESLRRELGKKE